MFESDSLSLIPRNRDAVPTQQRVFVGPVFAHENYTDNGDGTFTVAEQTFTLRDNSNHLGNAVPYVLPAETFDPPLGKSYLVADYNDGTPIRRLITNVELITESDVAPDVTVYREVNELHLLDWDGIGSGMTNRLHQRTVKTRRFERESGLKLSEKNTRELLLTTARVWYGANRILLGECDTAVDKFELWYHVAGVWTKADVTQYNNTQYDNGTDLVAIGNNKYTVNWIYRGIEYREHMIVVLGNEEYHDLATADNASEPPVPDLVVAQFLLVGRVLVEKDANTGIVQSSFDERFTPSAASNHENLANLLGALIGNHYHFATFATVADAEAAAGATTGAIANVLEENTWYLFDANPGFVRDGKTVLNTGDSGTTRWIAFAGRWQTLQYDDIFTDNLIVPAGNTGPDIVAIPGAPNISAFGFDGSNRTENLTGTMELLHGYREGTDVWPHLHWSPSTNGTGNVRWVFEFIVANGTTGVFSAPTILTAIQAAGGLDVSGRPIQQNLEFDGVIPGAGLKIGSQIRFTIRREPTNTLDTYAADALLWATGIHYIKDSMGSLERFIK